MAKPFKPALPTGWILVDLVRTATFCWTAFCFHPETERYGMMGFFGIGPAKKKSRMIFFEAPYDKESSAALRRFARGYYPVENAEKSKVNAHALVSDDERPEYTPWPTGKHPFSGIIPRASYNDDT